MQLADALRTLGIFIVAGLGTGLPPHAAAQAWKPDRAVEVVLSCAPGCGPDNTARTMQRIFTGHRLMELPLNVQNKAGGSGTVARAYLKQYEGNAHYLYHTDRGLLAQHVLGRANHNDFTPIAVLFGEYIGIAVKADSPIKSGRDLIERLKKDPTSVAVGLAAGGVGSTNHQGLASPLKGAGVDLRKTRNVTFSSGAQAIIALLGGHVDVVPVSIGLWVPHMKEGRVRVIAVSAPERLPDFFAGVPTWREQGSNTVVFNWRAMWGPKGITAPQIAYWENTLQRLTETPEWAAEMTLRGSVSQFSNAVSMKKRIEQEFPEVQALLVDLELAKK